MYKDSLNTQMIQPLFSAGRFKNTSRICLNFQALLHSRYNFSSVCIYDFVDRLLQLKQAQSTETVEVSS